MKEKLNVVKVGGNVINDEGRLDAFLGAFGRLDGRKVLVHGGGREATALAEKMSVQVKMIEGRRITDDAMIDIVTMVYGGTVNKRIVSKLQSDGCNAIGMTGADGNLILSDKRPVKNGLDYGWVGDPRNVNTSFLQNLITGDSVPVVAPLTHDGDGHMLNTNADTIGNVLASAMSQVFDVNLIYAFELNGVLEDIAKPDSVIETIDQKIYENLKQKSVIADGMIPKLDNAFNAIASGVSRVSIIRYDKIDQFNIDSKGYTTIC